MVFWTRLPNVVQLMIWLRRGKPCLSCKLECVRDGTYAHTATWSICTVWEPRLPFFFLVIHTINCKSKSLEMLPGGQTAVYHLDVAWFSAKTRPGSSLKWRESVHHRRSWGQTSHVVLFLASALKIPSCIAQQETLQQWYAPVNTGSTHTRWMLGSLPMTGIKGNAARHRQPRNQLNDRNCMHTKIHKFRHFRKPTHRLITGAKRKKSVTIYGL